MTDLLIDHIVADSSGKAHIRGAGTAVKVIAERHNLGETVEQAAYEFDLTLAQVHAALSYYYDHKAELDAVIQADHILAATVETIAEFKQRIDARNTANHAPAP